MNVYNSMPSVADMGMVWIGSGQPSSDVPMGLVGSESNEMLLDHDNIYYTPSHHSMSNQSMDDMHSLHNSHMNSMENYDMMHFIDMKHESNDSSYAEDENSQPVYMITTATQTLPCATRKIKPIKHPGLVLKTPIAYQSNTDPSVIPIQKDGIAVCEKCGAIGVKHAFYTRERRFCSMACARGYSGLIPEPLPHMNQSTPDNKQHFAKYRFTMKMEDDFTDTYLDQPFPQLSPPPIYPPPDDSLPLVRRKPAELADSFDWGPLLTADPQFPAAPVQLFGHAPMADAWRENAAAVGMKVEVENTDCEGARASGFADSFWVATVVRISGYKAQLRYEGFGSNNSKDFWVSLCSNQVHPVGWCATRGKPLIPPKTIEDKYSDWKDFLRKRLTGARTLPSNYSSKASESMKSRFECGLNLEVVDKNRISQVKLAIVHKIIGKRLNVRYYDLPSEDAGFWCHEDSPLLHPVGWAKKVNHHLVAPINYLERVDQGVYDDDDATEELFNPLQVGSIEYQRSGFCRGMKLEAIDPLNLSSICVATVMDVLNYGYIMIRIDTYDTDATGADWFCYHARSPCIFPAGHCERYRIALTPPKGYDTSTFCWPEYLARTGSRPADASLFERREPRHGFEEGMKMEAADLMDPRLVCVATVAKVAGRLLKVHFDGWEEEYDQWLDCESSDIYPVGWCHSVGHKLEGPPIAPKVTAPIVKSPKVKKKCRKKKTKTSLPKPTVVHSSASTSNYSLTTVTPELTPPEEDHFPPIIQELSPKEEEHAKEDDTIQEDDQPGPEAGEEPAGPDQNLPVSSSEGTEPPAERKVTSYVNGTNNSPTKLIPRLIDNSGGNNEATDLCPEDWNVFDVAQFLRVNDCASYCDSFNKKKIDGKLLLNLTKEDILDITGGKVGPSLKIYDLVQQLKIKVNPSQVRQMKANIKKFL